MLFTIHNSRHQSQNVIEIQWNEKNQAKNDGVNEIFRMEMYKKNNKYFELVESLERSVGEREKERMSRRL